MPPRKRLTKRKRVTARHCEEFEDWLDAKERCIGKPLTATIDWSNVTYEKNLTVPKEELEANRALIERLTSRRNFECCIRACIDDEPDPRTFVHCRTCGKGVCGDCLQGLGHVHVRCPHCNLPFDYDTSTHPFTVEVLRFKEASCPGCNTKTYTKAAFDQHVRQCNQLEVCCNICDIYVPMGLYTTHVMRMHPHPMLFQKEPMKPCKRFAKKPNTPPIFISGSDAASEGPTDGFE